MEPGKHARIRCGESNAMADPHAILSAVFGFSCFRPGQEEIVSTLLARENVLTVMPTGSGKSLCYQVPALALGGLAIVVSPLVALMLDQVVALQLQGVAAEIINSSRDRETNVAVWRRVAAGDVRLLYLSPERLMTERMLAALQRLPISLIAVDEAHCISQWGPSSAPNTRCFPTCATHSPVFPLARLQPQRTRLPAPTSSPSSSLGLPRQARAPQFAASVGRSVARRR